MAELGSGSTPRSNYPSTLDTNSSHEVDSPSSNKTLITAAKIEDGYAAIINIQTELGTDPAGTKADVKTFLQTGHNSNGNHGAVTATSLSASNGVDAGASGIFLKTKVIDIGDWNMDSTSTANVAHGVTLGNIRQVVVMIRDDAATTFAPLDIDNSTAQGGYVTIGTTNVVLSRILGGLFDTASYDSTSYNRGWIVIEYV